MEESDWACPVSCPETGGVVTLFEGDAPQAPPASVRVDQGYREGSNVQAVQEMVSMMLGMRHYEAACKVLQTISDSVSQLTRSQPA